MNYKSDEYISLHQKFTKIRIPSFHRRRTIDKCVRFTAREFSNIAKGLFNICAEILWFYVPCSDEPRLHPSEVHYIIVYTDLTRTEVFLDCGMHGSFESL
jgi:hypothetical protein